MEPAISLITILGDVPDPRRGNAQRHDRLDILTTALVASICGAESGVDFAEFAADRAPLLREFLILENGLQSHDTFSRVFRLLDPAAFGRAFAAVLDDLGEDGAGGLAIDGKTLRRSFDRAAGRSALHVVRSNAIALRPGPRVIDRIGDLPYRWFGVENAVLHTGRTARRHQRHRQPPRDHRETQMRASMNRRTLMKSAGASALVAAVGAPGIARAAAKTFKVGQLGVMSGAEASWGLVNKYCALATAAMWNEQGGVEIGGDTYMIEVVSVDERNDPRLAVSGAERLMGEEGIRYVLGPNTDVTATSVRPIAEKYKAIYFPYASSRELFTQPAENAIMGMVASYQVAPAILDLVKAERGVSKVAFVARNDSDGLSNRNDCLAAAQRLGLEVVVGDATYESNTTDFFPVMAGVVDKAPDLIFLPASAPANTPLLMRAARELGYTGLFASDSGQDIKVIKEMAGDLGNGLISIGGASTAEIRSEYMDRFIAKYTEVAGEWNDEAGTKVYALEIILGTLKAAGPEAITNTDLFKAQIPTFQMRNPFLREESVLAYTGETDYGQKRQIGVPLVLTETVGGEFATIWIGAVK